MNLVKKILHLRYAEANIRKEVELLAHAAICIEPVATLSRNYDGDLANQIISDLNPICLEISSKYSHKLQQYTLAQNILRMEGDIALNVRIRKSDEPLKILWYSAISEMDDFIYKVLDSIDSELQVFNGDIENKIALLDALLLRRFIKEVAILSVLKSLADYLFFEKFEDDKYDIFRRHDLLLKQHLNKLEAELAIKYVPDMIDRKISGRYNLQEAIKRNSLLLRFYNAVESVNFAELDLICSDFVEVLEENFSIVQTATNPDH